MFEKEAEEYREKEKDKGYYWVTQEMEQSELDTIVDESFKDGAEFGYNKANEWHYVADDDLPKNTRYVWTNIGAGYHDDDGWWDDHGRLQGVVAWCEPIYTEE